MKKILLWVCIIGGFTVRSNAQVSKTKFETLLGTYTDYWAKGNTDGEIKTLETLNGLMQSQISWLQSRSQLDEKTAESDMAKAKADRDKADALKSKGEADQRTAMEEETRGDQNKGVQDMVIAKNEIEKAKEDKGKALVEMDKANKEFAAVTSENINLVTEQNMYKDIQVLKGNYLHANKAEKDKIIADLKTFDSTLQ